MASFIYPKYNRNTHETIIDCDLFDVLPTKPLIEFLRGNTVNIIKAVNTVNIIKAVKGTKFEVLETFIGHRGLYSKIFYDNKTYFVNKANIALLSEIARQEINPNFTETDIPLTDTMKSGVPNILNTWYSEENGQPFFDPKSAKWYVTVITDHEDYGTQPVFEGRALEALVEGTQKILKFAGKRSDRSYCESILVTGGAGYKAFFEFTRVIEWFIDPRPCSKLKFLISIPNQFLTSPDVEEAPTVFNGENETLSILGLAGNGAGDSSKVKKVVMIRMDGFTQFIDHIDLLKETIEDYANRQDIYIEEYNKTHLTYLTNSQLKRLLDLDLIQESKKFSDNDILDFVNTVRDVLLINDVDITSVYNQNNILLNHVAFGFDDKSNICYLEVFRNGIPIPLVRFSSDKFIKPVGRGGFSSIRTGFLLFSLAVDMQFAAPGGIITVQTKQELTKYEYEQWVNDHIKPAPKQLNFPLKSIDCVKDVVQKAIADAKLIASNVDNIRDAFNQAQLQRTQLKAARKASGKAVMRKASNEPPVYDAVWRQMKRFHNDQNVKRLIIELVVCLSRRIDYTQFLEDLKVNKKVSENIRKFLIASLCNKTVAALLGILSKLPKIKKVNTTDPNAALIRQLRKAISQTLLKLYALILQYITDLIAQACADPNAGFDTADQLGIDAAIADALENAAGINSPAVNNLFDDLGLPASGGGAGSGLNASAGTDRATQEDLNNVKNLVKDLACILTPEEFCQVMVAGNTNGIKEQIILNIIEKRYPKYKEAFPDIESLGKLLTSIGKALNVYDACVAFADTDPPNDDRDKCADKRLLADELNRLRDRDIPEEALNDLLNDLAKKRNDQLLDLLNSLVRPSNEALPAFCVVSPDGKFTEGLVNAAKADPEYARMFQDQLDANLADIYQIFNKELKEWKVNTVKRSFADEQLLKEINDEIAPKASDASLDPQGRKKAKADRLEKLLVRKGFIKKRRIKVDKNKYEIQDDYEPNTGLKEGETGEQPAFGNVDAIKLEVVPHVRANLAKQKIEFVPTNSRASGSLSSFYIDLSTERQNFTSTVIASIQVGEKAEIDAAIGETIVELGTKIAGKFTSILNQAIFDDDFGSSESLIGLEAGNLLSKVIYGIDVVVAAVSAMGAFYSNPPEQYKNYSDLTSSLRPDLSNLNSSIARVVGDEQQPIPLDRPTAGGSASREVPTFPPLSTVSCEAAVTNVLNDLNETARNIQLSNLGQILGLINEIQTATLKLFQTINNISKQKESGMSQVLNISASYPDYKIDFRDGFGINNAQTSSYELIITKNPQTFLSGGVPKTNDGNFIQTGFSEPIDSDLQTFISTKALISTNPNETKSFKQFAFEKRYNRNDYNDVQQTLMRNIFNFVSSSQFFEVSEQTVTFGGDSSLPPVQIPYINQLALEEYTTSIEKLKCNINQNLADIDDVKKDAFNRFIEDSCNFQEPTPDGNRTKQLDPVEKNISNALVLITIRIYLYDYLLKGIFPFWDVWPDFINDRVMVDFMASYMESEMKNISPGYFSNFINEAQRFYDNQTIRSAEDLTKPKNELLRVKREKLKILISNELLNVSKRFGTKMLQVKYYNDTSFPTGSFDPFTANKTKVDDIRNKLISLRSGQIDTTIDFLLTTFEVQSTRQNILTGTDLSINNLSSVEAKFLFQFCFPVKRYLCLATIFCILANNALPVNANTFNATKGKLANLHNNIMSAQGPLSNINPMATVSMDNISNFEMLSLDLKKYFIDAIIKTPLDIIKGAAEAGGDLNAFIAALPYTIIKPVWLSVTGEIPFRQKQHDAPFYFITPLIGGILSFFLPPFLIGIAYYLTLRWWDDDYWADPGNIAKDEDKILNLAIERLTDGNETVDEAKKCRLVSASKTFNELLAEAAKGLPSTTGDVYK